MAKVKAVKKTDQSFAQASNDSAAVDPRYTHDKQGNVLKFNDGKFWYKRTLDNNGNELRLENSHGFWFETTYDALGNILTEKSSQGYLGEYMRDNKGNVMTFKNSNGIYVKYTRDEAGNQLSKVSVKI